MEVVYAEVAAPLPPLSGRSPKNVWDLGFRAKDMQTVKPKSLKNTLEGLESKNSLPESQGEWLYAQARSIW